jgi:hypothetical protein
MQVNVCSTNPELTAGYDWDKPVLPQQPQQKSDSGSISWYWVALGVLALVVISSSGSGGEK